MCRNVITLCLGITLNCLESLYTRPGTFIYSRTRPVLRLAEVINTSHSLSYLALWKIFNTSEHVHKPPLLLHLKSAGGTVCD